MKHALICLFFALLSTSAIAADPWSKGDVAREAVYQVLDAADWLQTRYIASYRLTKCTTGTGLYYSNWTSTSCQTYQHPEFNPLLGRSPTVGKVNVYFALSGLVHIGVSHMLPSEWREAWQYITIGWEAGLVEHNRRVGIGMNVPW